MYGRFLRLRLYLISLLCVCVCVIYTAFFRQLWFQFYSNQMSSQKMFNTMPQTLYPVLHQSFDFTDTELLRLKGTFACHLVQPPTQAGLLCGDATGHAVKKALLQSRKGITIVLLTSAKHFIIEVYQAGQVLHTLMNPCWLLLITSLSHFLVFHVASNAFQN